MVLRGHIGTRHRLEVRVLITPFCVGSGLLRCLRVSISAVVVFDGLTIAGRHIRSGALLVVVLYTFGRAVLLVQLGGLLLRGLVRQLLFLSELICSAFLKRSARLQSTRGRLKRRKYRLLAQSVEQRCLDVRWARCRCCEGFGGLALATVLRQVMR